MSVARTHHYILDPADLDELLARRATLIATVRESYPGLTETRLTRLADGTYTDVWRWDSTEQMQAALAAAPTIPDPLELGRGPNRVCPLHRSEGRGFGAAPRSALPAPPHVTCGNCRGSRSCSERRGSVDH
jgi:hypothetical protein